MFQFKKFVVNDDDCAMKVGTDAVLLGAWLQVSESQKRVLDVGTGSGIIALMLAQRFDWIQIDAIEIDERASIQCDENFRNSIWNARLTVKNCSFQDFVKLNHQPKFDMLFSNPPFFETHNQIDNKARNTARNLHFLPYDELIMGSKLCLSKTGKLALIIPYSNFELVVAVANQHQMCLQQVCHVKGAEKANFKRSLVVFGFENLSIKIETLILRNSKNEYTDTFKSLVNDFFIKF